MQDGSTIAGHRLTGRTRISEIGTWNDAVSPGGTPSGVLRFDPLLVSEPSARSRLITVVTADRRLQQTGLSGLLPIADLVTARGDIWLISGRRAVPTVADLLAEGGAQPDAGSVATIMMETAQSLLGLHAAGLAHGALHPGTVVIGEDGSALLAERGLLEALRGQPYTRERDIAAWAALARGLSANWARGPAAGLFERAATAAARNGLSAARDTLLAGRDLLPPGFTARERLIESMGTWSAAAVTTSPAPGSGPDTGEIVTLLAPPPRWGAVRAESGAAAPGAAAPGAATPGAGAPGAAAFGAPVPGGHQPDGVMRFGPGVPPETTAAQIWRSGRTQGQQGPQPAKERATLGERNMGMDAGRGPHARRPGRSRHRRKTAWTGTLLLAILVAALILWLRQTSEAEIAVEKVNVSAPKKALSCDGTANIVGTITTNGGTGTIRYIWLRSDGQKLNEQKQRVLSGATSVELPLHWKVTGSGNFKGTATLRVLSPTSNGKPLQDKASFSYRC